MKRRRGTRWAGGGSRKDLELWRNEGERERRWRGSVRIEMRTYARLYVPLVPVS